MQIFGNNHSSDKNRVVQINYTAHKAWKALHFVMCILQKLNKNTKSLAHTSLVRHILEYGTACWGPCREGQINVLDRVHTKAAQSTDHTKNSDWANVDQRRTVSRLRALFKARSGERVWKATREEVAKGFLFE